MTVRTTRTAEVQIATVDGWWRSNRTKAPDLFLDAPVDLVLPLAATFGPRYRSVWVGMRVQAVMLPTNETDQLQLSLGPWLRVAVGCGFLEASYIANAGEPMAGARGPGIWGLHVGGGGSL